MVGFYATTPQKHAGLLDTPQVKSIMIAVDSMSIVLNWTAAGDRTDWYWWCVSSQAQRVLS